MVLSLIIPTRNRGDALCLALESIFEQRTQFDKVEIIVVDNGSIDDTQYLVTRFIRQHNNFIYVYEPSPGLHVGRHVGCQNARGDIIVYCDDDIIALPTWLASVASSFEDQETVLVGGKCLPKFETTPPDWIAAMWEPNQNGDRILGSLSLIDLGDEEKPVDPYHVFGCNFAIRRSVLEEAGGFHPDAMPDELIRFRGDGETHVSRYIKEQGYKAVYNPAASVYHQVPRSRMTVEYFCRRAYNQGISDSYTAIRKAHGLDGYAPEVNIEPRSEASDHGRMKNLYWQVRNKPIRDLPGAVWRRARRALFPQVSQSASESKENMDPHGAIQQRISAAYRSGYAFHQQEVAHDLDLLKWVLREDYWDAPLPLSTGPGQ